MPTAPTPSNQELLRIGGELFRAGAFDRAVATLSQITQAEPLMFAQGLALIGRCFGRQGDAARAQDALVRSLKIKDLALSRYYLGECLFHQGEHFAAEQQLSIAVAADDKLTDAYILLGSIHRIAGKPALAIQAFNMALRNDPKAVAARFQLAQTAYDTGDLQRATAQASMIVQQSEDFAPVHVLLGHCALRLNDFRQAAYEYCRALVHASPSIEVYEGLGRAFANLKDYEQAIRAFEAVTMLDPDHEMAYIAAARLCERTGNSPRAVQLWKSVQRFDKYAEMAAEALSKLGSEPVAPTKGKKGARVQALAKAAELPRDFVPPEQFDRATLPQRTNQAQATAPLTTHAAGTLSLASRQAPAQTRPMAFGPIPEPPGVENKLTSAFEQLVRPYAEALASIVTRARKPSEPEEPGETVASFIANSQSQPVNPSERAKRKR